MIGVIKKKENSILDKKRMQLKFFMLNLMSYNHFLFQKASQELF